MSEPIRADRVIEIDPKRKYVLVFEERLTDGDVERIQKLFKEFMEGDSPICVISGSSVQLIDAELVEIVRDANEPTSSLPILRQQ